MYSRASSKFINEFLSQNQCEINNLLLLARARFVMHNKRVPRSPSSRFLFRSSFRTDGCSHFLSSPPLHLTRQHMDHHLYRNAKKRKRRKVMRSLEVCLVQCRAASSWINEPIGPYLLRLEFDWTVPLNLLWASNGWETNLQFRARLSWMCSGPCCESMCRRRSTLRWKAREQRWHWNGLKPVCFRLCVMRFDDWEKAFPQTRHLCGFSPKYTSIIRSIPKQSSTRYEMRSISWERKKCVCVNVTHADEKHRARFSSPFSIPS